MPSVIDVVFGSHSIVAYFDDDTKVEGRYASASGKPQIIGFTSAQRTEIVNFYNRATPSVRADIRYLAFIRANESLTEAEHTLVDHSSVTGVGGGAATGEVRRYYFPLENAKLTTGLVSITGATTPSIETSSGLTRIAWPVGNTGGVAFTTGIPFEDHDTGAGWGATLHLALSQDGTELVSGSVTFSVDLDGGGGIFGSTLFSWLGSTSILVLQAGSIGTLSSPPVTDVRQVFFSLTSAGSSTDIVYLNSAWVEVPLI